MITINKILIIGGSGLLGRKLYKLFKKKKYDIYATFYQNPIEKEGCFQIDITQKDYVYSVFKKFSPDVVVHTAAFTNVDECEKNKDKAFAVNVQGTKNIVDMADKIGAKVVYISTDFVFDGKKGMYTETDSTKPINYYGITKLDGERIVNELLDDYIIARTSVLYGWNPFSQNFVTWVINQLENRTKIKVAIDLFNTPTLADDLADLLIKLIERDETGIFHVSGNERISRYDFAINIAKHFNLRKEMIEPISFDQLNLAAKRPKDTSLDVSKISKIKKPLDINGGLTRMKEG